MQRYFQRFSSDSSGRVSAGLALACAVHCIAMPVIATALPLLGLQFLDSVLFELILVGAGLSFGAYSVIKGYRKGKPVAIPVVFFAGAALLVIGILSHSESFELMLVVVGALAVAIAQMVNLRHVHVKECAAH